MSTKVILKSARQSLKDNDPENVLYLCNKITDDIDPDNYYAYIFKGKAHLLLQQTKEAIESYDRAISIDKDDPLGWKGLLELASKSLDFEQFFKVITGLAIALSQTTNNFDEIVETVRGYLAWYGPNKPEGFEECYLRNIIPGSQLGDLLGERFDTTQNSLGRLIAIVQAKENMKIKLAGQKYRMKMPKNLNEKQLLGYNEVIWEIYKDSEVYSLLDTFINVCIDDKERHTYEEKFLKYKFELLKVAPAEKKKELFQDVYSTCSGMVVVKSPSQFAWELYFDWSDCTTLADLDLSIITNYIKIFGNVGLGAVLYAFILSDVSPFDKEKVREYLKVIPETISRVKPKREKKKKLKLLEKGQKVEDIEPVEPNDDELLADNIQASTTTEQSEEHDVLIAAEVVALMNKGLEDSPKTILGHRIATEYHIHMKEYETALDYSKKFISLISQEVRRTSVLLPNSRKDSILALATIYTYYESPKNFPKALNLYDTILASSPNNVKAKVGKGLILVEKKEYKLAESLLGDVFKEFPDNTHALLEHSWCTVQLVNYAIGRQGLEKALKMIKGTDGSSFELRAITLWRLAESFLIELINGTITDQTTIDEMVKIAYDYLIQSLKQSTSLAPSYTSLGFIYLNYYNNKSRALKCFYKAFELDPGELGASKELVKDFSDQRDWEMVDIICQRVVESDNGKRMLAATTVDPSWPYRMLGCSALEKQDDVKAIEFFQNALRVQPSDVGSWVGLGEGYLARGRLEASLKVFSHALTLDSENWQAGYLLAVVQSQMGEFEDSIGQLNGLLHGSRPNEMCVLTTLFETLVAKVACEVSGGYVSRSLDTALQAFETIMSASNVDPTSQRLWRSLSDLLRLMLTVQAHISKIPFDTLSQILSNAPEAVSPSELINDVSVFDSLESFDTESHFLEGKYLELVLYYLIQSSKKSLSCTTLKTPKLLRSSLTYNLGLAYLESYKQTDSTIYRDCSIKVIKKAVQLESDNASYWSTLGNASLTKNAKVSQHCFIKAAALESKDPGIWTNLAVLYLHYGDFGLAKECFTRAQSIAPTQSACWSGQALVAQADGDLDLATKLFTHSLVISNGRQPLAMLLYGLSVIQRLGESGSDERNLDMVQELNVANSAMLNYLKYHPGDQLTLNVSTTIIERVHGFDIGIKLSTELCNLLVMKYEESEDTTVLVNLAKAKSQQARLYLGAQEFELAVESANMSIELLNQVEDLNDAIQRCILSSLTVLGLSHFFQEDLESSLNEFKKILEISPESKRIVVLIAQVLYAYDSPETKQTAIDELFSNIENFGTSLIVALALASVSIVEDLNDYLPAIKEELASLPLEDQIDDTYHDVPYLLKQINNRLAIGANETIWQRNAFLFPSENKIWENLNDSVNLNVVLYSKNVEAGVLSDAYVKSGELREIQRGLFLNPSNVEGFVALKGCL